MSIAEGRSKENSRENCSIDGNNTLYKFFFLSIVFFLLQVKTRTPILIKLYNNRYIKTEDLLIYNSKRTTIIAISML